MAQTKSVQNWKIVLQQNLVRITHSMKTDRLVPYLIQHDIISDDDMDTFKELATETEKAEWLVNHLRRYASDIGFEILMFALREERQTHVADFIDAKLKELILETTEAKRSMEQDAAINQVSPQPRKTDSNFASCAVIVSPSSSLYTCKHQSAGCNEVVTPDTLEYHAEFECQYRPTLCKNCGQEVSLRDIVQHMSVCATQDCVKPCPLCNKQYSLAEMKQHVGQCDGYHKRSCTFFKKGCSFIGSSFDIDCHNQVASNQHIELLLTHVEGLEYNQRKMMHKIRELENAVKENDRHQSKDTCIQATSGSFGQISHSRSLSAPESGLVAVPKHRERCMSFPTVSMKHVPVAAISPIPSPKSLRESPKIEYQDSTKPEMRTNSIGKKLLQNCVTFVCESLINQIV